MVRNHFCSIFRSLPVLLLSLLFVFFYHQAQASKGLTITLGADQPDKQTSIELYGGSYALLIGVSNYTAGWPSLESIPGEISNVETLLLQKGFSVEKHLDPDHRELRKVFENFIIRYGYEPKNRLLFYFSGHGHTRKNGKKGYLVPVDAPNPNNDDRGFVKTALGMNQVLSWARDIEAKHALFLFDSCFSGTIFKQRDLPTPPKHITKLTAEPVRQFITAGTAGEVVPANSTFTPVFIDGLQHGLADLDGDGYIRGTELGLYLQKKVPQYTNQNPQFGKIRDYDLDRGDFIFLAGGVREDPKPASLNKKNEISTGILKVTSAPPGADIIVDGTSKGKTPLEIKNVSPGELSVTVKKDGYATEKRQSTVDANRTTILSLHLQQLETYGWLNIHATPASSKVRFIDSDQEYTPDMELKPGTFQIEISATGYRTEIHMVEIIAGAGIALDVTLEKIAQEPVKVKPKSATFPIGEKFSEPLTNMEFMWVDEDCFEMGDIFGGGKKDELPVHEVCLDGFYAGKYEVTQDVYLQIVGSNPSRFQKGNVYIEPTAAPTTGHMTKFRKSVSRTGKNHPVENASWEDAHLFIKKLNQKTGLTFRLPTEAEWEYIARGGGKRLKYATSSTRSVFFETYLFIQGAWGKPGSGRVTHKVGSAEPNSLGFYDLSGNVREWCLDWYSSDYYQNSPRNNPTGPVIGSERVNRGGSWYDYATSLKTTKRMKNKPGMRNDKTGFRLVLSK